MTRPDLPILSAVGRVWLEAGGIAADIAVMPNILRRLTLLSPAALLLAGCAKKSLEPLQPGETILAFGDSLTEGVGVSKALAYPAVLEALTGNRVVNAGRSGEITAEGRARLPGVLDEVRPRLMILLHGGNDILRNLSPSQASANLSAMIEAARARGIMVVLLGVPQKNLFSDSAPIYHDLAERFDLVFNDSLVADLLRSPSKKSDAVHFNESGYRQLAESLAQMLADAGAV